MAHNVLLCCSLLCCFVPKFVKSNNWANYVCSVHTNKETKQITMNIASIYRVKTTRTESSCFHGFRRSTNARVSVWAHTRTHKYFHTYPRYNNNCNNLIIIIEKHASVSAAQQFISCSRAFWHLGSVTILIVAVMAVVAKTNGKIIATHTHTISIYIQVNCYFQNKLCGKCKMN